MIHLRKISRGASVLAHWVWDHLPFQRKQQWKHNIFNMFPAIFGWTGVYRNWANRIADQDGLEFEYVPILKARPLVNKSVRLICFYQPGFHPDPEHDDGIEEFVEWTNIRSAKPQFKGHYQPHFPGELGCYNVLDLGVQARQIELAKLYGIEGFCFNFYWFGGKRLSEAPIEKYLNDKQLDLPFCLCWNNENWNRCSGGMNSELEVAQIFSPEDDLAFIQYVAKYMMDERYIRIDGKPLLLIYRPDLLPSAQETAKRWREWCNINQIGEIYLAYTQSFEAVDPAIYGLDAAIEFPPNTISLPEITKKIKPFHERFSGKIYDWNAFVKRSRAYYKPDYMLFRSVCPAWDDTVIKKVNSTIYLNSNPQSYQEWLKNAVTDTCSRIANSNERLVFINAWNEWTKGSHLEPDQHYGYAYLDATRRALVGPSSKGQLHQIIIVSHDAHPHGAQQLALNMAREFSQVFGFNVDLICLSGGVLMSQYAKHAQVHELGGFDHRGSVAHALVRKLVASGHRFAIVNTTVSGFFLETLKAHGIHCISLVHEMRGVLDRLHLHEQAKTIARLANKVVFPARQVADEFQEIAPVNEDQLVLRPQGLYKKKNMMVRQRESTRKMLRKEFSLPPDALIVLGVGTADHRKGVDLFVEAGKSLVGRLPNAYLIWLGHWAGGVQLRVEQSLAKVPQINSHFIFPGRRDDTDLFYAGADVYALTSREDPFPSVVLEAMDASLPVVGFEGVGGCAELFAVGCGRLVPAFDTEAFSCALEEILDDRDLAKRMGKTGLMLVRERFSFRNYLFDLLKILDYPLPRVSVIVPTCNQSDYLSNRISTIESQEFPVYELIILDNCSSDESVKVAENIIEDSFLDIKYLRCNSNSDSVFSQWIKAVKLATGDLVWIAEAYDLAEDSFVAELSSSFDDPTMVLAYTQSKMINNEGETLRDDYLHHIEAISERWHQSYVCQGTAEISAGMAVKNTIPYVSAVLFRRTALEKAFAELGDSLYQYKVAGEWLLYLHVLHQGRVYFSSKALNSHRHHDASATHSTLAEMHLKEARQVQDYAASIVTLPEENKHKAAEYLASLRDQIQLPDQRT